MGDVLVGTVSWADKSLLDSRLFYPKEARSAEARRRSNLAHIAHCAQVLDGYQIAVEFPLAGLCAV